MRFWIAFFPCKQHLGSYQFPQLAFLPEAPAIKAGVTAADATRGCQRTVPACVIGYRALWKTRRKFPKARKLECRSTLGHDGAYSYNNVFVLRASNHCRWTEPLRSSQKCPHFINESAEIQRLRISPTSILVDCGRTGTRTEVSRFFLDHLLLQPAIAPWWKCVQESSHVAFDPIPGSFSTLWQMENDLLPWTSRFSLVDIVNVHFPLPPYRFI